MSLNNEYDKAVEEDKNDFIKMISKILTLPYGNEFMEKYSEVLKNNNSIRYQFASLFVNQLEKYPDDFENFNQLFDKIDDDDAIN